ncbi:cation-transporting P-type ATPase, partial [Streptomyces gamaensis]
MVWAPEGPAPRQETPRTALEVLRALECGPGGLTETEAEERLARCGENVLPQRRPTPWPRRFARSLRDPFTVVLTGLGLVSAGLASWGTAAVIAVLVVVSCVLRSTGEHRADRAVAALRELIPATATVRRRPAPGGSATPREVPVEELVPGDVVLLAPGDLVPADVRLLRARGLTVREASLTGESVPVAKRVAGAGGGVGCGSVAPAAGLSPSPAPSRNWGSAPDPGPQSPDGLDFQARPA